MRWNRKTILDEIRELHRRGDDLSFSSAEENHLNLVRAASWHYGTWKSAVELAGLDYEAISKYRRWSRERVLQAIRAHYAAGRDLSWRSISTSLDPPLAAAALRPGVGFETWREAVIAAGLNHDEVARYRHWTPQRVIDEITVIARKNEPLSSKIVQINNQPLYCAARRRFQTWNGALEAAGIEPQSVRLRRAPRENLSHRLEVATDVATKVRAEFVAETEASASSTSSAKPRFAIGHLRGQALQNEAQDEISPKAKKPKIGADAEISPPKKTKKSKKLNKSEKADKKPQKMKRSNAKPPVSRKNRG